MEWHNLLNPTRLDRSTDGVTTEIRSQFMRDYDRIIFSPEFRKLQSKTQVFPLPKETFVHNRLTHSLEVASVGRSLAKIVSDYLIDNKIVEPALAVEIPTLVSTACLAHDMGNPPFGHSGEDSISSFFADHSDLKSHYDDTQWNDLIRFEGNANALRLLTHQYKGRRTGGFALTLATLATMIKYPYSSSAGKKKYGFFDSEKAVFEKITAKCGLINHGTACRHPLGYLVEAADDISYLIMDMEDAHRLGILSTDEVLTFWTPFLQETDHYNKFSQKSTSLDAIEKISYLRSLTINILITGVAGIYIDNLSAILSGQPLKPLADNLPESLRENLENCKKVSFERIYTHPLVQRLEIVGHKVLTSLLSTYMESILKPDKKISMLIIQTLPEKYQPTGTVYENTRLVVDYVASLSDFEALRIYRELNGIDLPGQIF